MDLELVDDLKQPEYTGENRCAPCTILNLAIAAVVGSLIARKSTLGGILAVGISIALIYLRGYLVPGTPTLTKRYLPPEVLRWFGKEPEPELASGFGGAETAASASAGETRSDDSDPAATDVEITVDDENATADETTGIEAGTETDAEAGTETDDSAPADSQAPLDLEQYFLTHEILEPCADRDDLCLTEPFESAWFDRIETIGKSGVDAAATIDAFGFDADPEAYDLESREDVQLLISDHGVAGRWPSRPALLADIAASRVLEGWTADWADQDPEVKGQILNGLRMFLETCPTGGAVSMDEEVVESCCSSHDVVAVTCDETGERLFEQRLDSVDA